MGKRGQQSSTVDIKNEGQTSQQLYEKEQRLAVLQTELTEEKRKHATTREALNDDLRRASSRAVELESELRARTELCAELSKRVPELQVQLKTEEVEKQDLVARLKLLEEALNHRTEVHEVRVTLLKMLVGIYKSP